MSLVPPFFTYDCRKKKKQLLDCIYNFATIKSERVKLKNLILNLEESHYNYWKCWLFYPRRVDESDVPSKQQSSSQDTRGDSHSTPRVHLLLKCL